MTGSSFCLPSRDDVIGKVCLPLDVLARHPKGKAESWDWGWAAGVGPCVQAGSKLQQHAYCPSTSSSGIKAQAEDWGLCQCLPAHSGPLFRAGIAASIITVHLPAGGTEVKPSPCQPSVCVSTLDTWPAWTAWSFSAVPNLPGNKGVGAEFRWGHWL